MPTHSADLRTGNDLAALAPDLVLLNASIHTLDPARPTAEALAVVGDTIAALGSTAEMRTFAAPRTQIIDAGKKLVLPGFNDAHVHFLMGGFSLANVDLRDAQSPTELARRLGVYAQRLAKGHWILGGDWDHERWPPGSGLPTRQLIDAATPDHPVFVNRLDGHMALANSAALRLAGINAQTKDPPGGLIVRDPKTLEPTGILKDAAQQLVERVIPAKSSDEKYHAARAATGHAASVGVTSLTDMSAGDDLGIYQQLLDRGELKTRVYCARSIVSWEPLVKTGLRAPFGNPMLRLGALKGFADGSLGSSTALFFQPYADTPDTHGLLFDQMLPEGAMLKRALPADAAALQIMIHAIGDEANARILDLFGAVARQNPGRDHRFRIEHAQHLRPQDILRFAQLHVIASVQPSHLADDGRWCEKRIGPERSRYTYPFRSLLDSGASLAFGSDWTVAPLNPLVGIKAAVTRQTLDGKHPDGWFPQEKITLDEAIRAYTVGSAYAEFAEHTKGTLSVGKLADLVILDRDLYQIPADQMDQARVTLTLLGGKVVYQLR